MLQSKTSNPNQSNSQPNRFTLTDCQNTIQVVFFPQALGFLDVSNFRRTARLEYQGPEGNLIFQGDQITQQETPLGTLITVTLAPDLDAGGVSLTIALPPVFLAGQDQEFETLGVKVQTLGFVVNPVGPQLKYEVLNLKGVAQAESLPHPPDVQGVTVTDIDLLVLESFPPQLQIVARGTVPTEDWTNPQLVPVVYVQAPPDGIYDFTFIATPPEGIAAQIVTPIAARYIMFPVDGVKGVRVNGKLALLED